MLIALAICYSLGTVFNASHSILLSEIHIDITNNKIVSEKRFTILKILLRLYAVFTFLPFFALLNIGIGGIVNNSNVYPIKVHTDIWDLVFWMV